MQKYNHNHIIQWLERRLGKEYENSKIKIYRDLEESSEFQADVEKAKKEEKFSIYPRLSIDLMLVEKKLEPVDVDKQETEKGEKKNEEFNHYKLFFAISSETIFKDKESERNLERRLLFYQFYLSRISEPKRLEIIVVTPHYVNIPSQSSNFFEENGFGLWKIDKDKRIDDKDGKETVVVAKNLRDRMRDEFIASIDDPKYMKETIKEISKKIEKDKIALKEAIKNKKTAEDLATFFDQYILDSVDAISGVTPGEFGKRYIDRNLLNRMFELEKVSYSERLKELVNEQLDENDDDYEFVTEVFSTLWEENIGIPYSKFLEIFEPVLLHVFAESEKTREKFYRDHYIHQFQVFLLGLYIVDNFYDDFVKYNCVKPEITWLIIASFHDMAYPVQLYDDWCTEFFHRVFSVDIKLAHLDLKSNFVDQSFLSCMGYLISELHRAHEGKYIEANWLADKKELVLFFYREITEKKNHCILSSVSLLRLVQTLSFNEKNTVRKRISNDKDEFDDILKKVFVPAALAIALHDKEVWQELRKESDKDNPPKILDNMEFEKHPLSFLLIFCDNIQEWGRPSKSRADKGGGGEMKFYLQSIKGDSEAGLDITIWTPKYTKSEPFFMDKQNELRAIQFFLKQPPNIKFTIHLKDKNDAVEDFKMEGRGES